MGYSSVKSVKKAFSILELLTGPAASDRGLTLAEISRTTGLLPVTARNLLKTMEECGYVRRIGHGKYREGDKCARLFQLEGVLQRLKEVADPLVRQMVQELGESVLLVSIIHNRRVELLRVQGPQDHMIDPQWYANEKFYQMRTTRAVLAWLNDEQLTSFLSAHGLPTTEDWPECGKTTAGLNKQLATIRKEGGCHDIHGGQYALAVPILTASNQVAGSLGCYASCLRTDLPRATGIFQMLHDCASKIQTEMTRQPSSC